MLKEVLKKVGSTWVVVTYKNGLVVDWRIAVSAR